MILFYGLPVPSTLFLFMCACFPCEHVWVVIGRNVRARDPRNVIMSATWIELSLMNETDSRSVSASMRGRCRAVIDANSGHTRYYSNIQTKIFPSRNLIYLYTLLAHLSRRLIGELIVYEGIRRPSVRPSSSVVVVNIFKRLLI